MPPPTPRTLIVTGATGKQGNALIRALLTQDPPAPFKIYALTRNPTSPRAQALARDPDIQVIQGDFDSAAAIFTQVEKPWGLFAMTDQMAGEAKERAQGTALVRAAAAAGVQHIVFSATERGGQEASDDTPTPVPHFRSKFHVEREIRAQAAASQGRLTWTFLRPVAFFENLTPGFFGRGYVAMWRLNGMERKLQHVSTSDIGRVAAEAFLKADTEEYRDKAISLAGDELSPAEAASIFREVTGKELPASYGFVGRLLKRGVADLRHMFDWFVAEGFQVDIPLVRRRYPYMKDFRTWLTEESAWKQ